MALLSRSKAPCNLTMKIATYNLRAGGKAKQRIHWTQLFEVANPDIFRHWTANGW